MVTSAAFIALIAVCSVLLFTLLLIAVYVLSRYLIMKKRSLYIDADATSPAFQLNKVVFGPDDLVWATGAKADATRSQETKTGSRGEAKRPGQSIMCSTISLDHRGQDHHIAYLSGKRHVFCSFVASSQMKVTNFKRKASYLKDLSTLTHDNINHFWGVFVDPYKQGFLSDYAKRGSLYDVLMDERHKKLLEWPFKQSLIRDLVNAMQFLHRSPLNYHGNLASTNCLISQRWMLKISGFGLNPLVESMSRQEKPEAWLWTAPEHLRANEIGGSAKGDVYSFGIILQEVITEGKPYSGVELSPTEILRRVEKPPPLCRPKVSKGLAEPPWIHLMKDSWFELPDMRPSFDDIMKRMKQISKGLKVDVMDAMMNKMDHYADLLEKQVQERTQELEIEKMKTEQLLIRMLPVSVAESLKAGNDVHPEHYDEVTIFFSDIVGFTTISAASNPMQIVTFLNTLYTRFDEIISHHDVYKVETIGDAYMCVSGLPNRNGSRHAGEIATMSLDLLSAISGIKVAHLPFVPIKLRIGCHSGHCAAGVVGHTMPRYCLFGDSVNTASRMESHGIANRIHLSSSTKELLDSIGGYHIRERGLSTIKGKGRMMTYWLVGKDNYDKVLPAFDEKDDENNGGQHGIENFLSKSDLGQLLENININSKTSTVCQLPSRKLSRKLRTRESDTCWEETKYELDENNNSIPQCRLTTEDECHSETKTSQGEPVIAQGSLNGGNVSPCSSTIQDVTTPITHIHTQPLMIKSEHVSRRSLPSGQIQHHRGKKRSRSTQRITVLPLVCDNETNVPGCCPEVRPHTSISAVRGHK